MGAVINRTNKQYFDSVDVTGYDPSLWVRYAAPLGNAAQLTAYLALRTAGVAEAYVKFDGSDNPSEMSAGEKSTVDAAVASAASAAATSAAQAAKAAATTGIDTGALQAGDKFERLCRAIVLVALDEINLLRTNAGLATRTSAQLVTAVKAKIAATAE